MAAYDSNAPDPGPGPWRLSSSVGKPERRFGEVDEQQKLLRTAEETLIARHMSPKTVKAYTYWIRRFLAFSPASHPRFLAEPAVNAFLTNLATEHKVAASTQNQALSALLFFFEKVLQQPLDRLEGVIRARRPLRGRVVLAREEVDALFVHLHGVPRLVCMLLYGSGLRLG